MDSALTFLSVSLSNDTLEGAIFSYRACVRLRLGLLANKAELSFAILPGIPYDALYQYLLDDSPNYHHRSSFSVVCDDQVKQKAVMNNYSFLDLVVNVVVQ